MYYVYKITNSQNTKVYIGITSQSLSTRWKWHVRAAQSGSPRAISCAIRKYGSESFEINLLETVQTLEDAKEREITNIKNHNSFKEGYNMTIGGDYIWEDQSLEFKEYHRRRVKEGKDGMTAEAKLAYSRKISEVWSNMDPNERAIREEKRKAGNRRFWDSLSKEERAKIANPSPRTQKYRLTDPAGNTFKVENLAQFCRERGLSAPGLNACAAGRYQQYKGWRCEKFND